MGPIPKASLVQAEAASSFGVKQRRTQEPGSIVRQQVMDRAVVVAMLADSDRQLSPDFSPTDKWRSHRNQGTLRFQLGRMMRDTDPDMLKARTAVRNIFIQRSAPSLRSIFMVSGTDRFSDEVMNKLSIDFLAFVLYLFKNWSYFPHTTHPIPPPP